MYRTTSTNGSTRLNSTRLRSVGWLRRDGRYLQQGSPVPIESQRGSAVDLSNSGLTHLGGELSLDMSQMNSGAEIIVPPKGVNGDVDNEEYIATIQLWGKDTMKLLIFGNATNNAPAQSIKLRTAPNNGWTINDNVSYVLHPPNNQGFDSPIAIVVYCQIRSDSTKNIAVSQV